MTDEIVKASEVEIETTDGGRTYRTIIWVVADGGEVFVRSVRGDDGKWYGRAVDNPRVTLIAGDERQDYMAIAATDTGTIDRVSEAISTKYLPSKSVARMNDPAVLHTTLRLDPVG